MLGSARILIVSFLALAATGAFALPAGAATRLVYVIDVSGSTSNPGGECGDVSGDGTPDTILECEIAGVIAMNERLVPFSPLPVSAIAFNDLATILDVSPVPGDQPFTDVAADADVNGVEDLVDAVRSLTSGGGTNFDEPLAKLSELGALAPATDRLRAAFISDGVASLDTGPGSHLQAVIDAGHRVDTFSLGFGAAGCDPESRLRWIADGTGGVCTEVTDPAQLSTVAWYTPPDADGDGRHDDADACPNQAAPGTANGCPPPDADGDGLPDSADACPAVAAPGTANGCPPAQSSPTPSPSPSPTPTVTPTPMTPDRTAPDTRIVRLKLDHRRRRATVTFLATESGATFRCKIDRGRLRPCRSPARFTRLRRGRHTVTVVATDAAGNVDQTPAVKRFRVRR